MLCGGVAARHRYVMCTVRRVECDLVAISTAKSTQYGHNIKVMSEETN